MNNTIIDLCIGETHISTCGASQSHLIPTIFMSNKKSTDVELSFELSYPQTKKLETRFTVLLPQESTAHHL